MRRSACWLSLLALSAGCWSSTPPAVRPPTVAQRGPLAQLEATRDLDGELVGPTRHATVIAMFASWCVHCRTEFQELTALRAVRPDIRILGVTYRGHEEYADRGSLTAVRAFVATSVPWLRVVQAGDALFAALGSPPKVPTILVFDARGALVATFDRLARKPPSSAELDALVGR